MAAAAVESTLRDPRAPDEAVQAEDPREGFAPPEGLTWPAPPLELSLLDLVPPAQLSPRERTVRSTPWPEGLRTLPLDAPTPTPDGSRPCRQERYLPHDARPLQTVELEYDAQGRVVQERIDDDSDGTIDLRVRYAWATDGLLAQKIERFGPQPSCEGKIPGYTVTTTYDYDQHGAWLGQRRRADGQVDPDSVGRRVTYDEAERPV
ncbi:MAG: hypothetical protein KDK70_42860, partial [Myxococcales bacterium]|nr:hypothetical protein [Myxococcales bacterium]